MKRLVLFLTLLAFGALQLLQAQAVEISGTVRSSEDGSPMPGASVIIKGTTTGTISDANGNYVLRVPAGATELVVSFMGMKTQDVRIEGRTIIDIMLEVDILGQFEVVVTALGINREKKSLGYAVQEVSGEEINKVKSDNFINSISGKVAGVYVKPNGNLGGSTNIVIRGAKSFIGNNQAMFVIDGVPVNNSVTNNDGQVAGRSGFDYGNNAADIDPNDIESISVLKGAAATALYGSRAANGVIMITTKKGKKMAGKALGVSLNSSVSFGLYDKSTFPTYQKEYGAGYGPWYSGGDHPGLEEYDLDGDGTDDLVVPFYDDASLGEKFDPNLMVYQWESLYPESSTYQQKTPWGAAKNGPGTFFETGLTLSNNIELVGGGEKTTYRLSYTNLNQTGIMPNSSLKRNNITLTATNDLTKNLKVTASANYVNTKGKGRNSTGYSDNIMSSFRQWCQVNVDIKALEDLYNKTGRNTTWNPTYADDLTPIYWDNPYWVRYENYETDARDRIIGYIQADYKITSFLNLMGRVSIDTYSSLQEERKAVGSVAGELGVGRLDVTSGYSRLNQSFNETNIDFMANFNKDLTENINLTALLGTNIRRLTDDRVFASTNGGISVPEVYALNVSVSPMLPPEENYFQIGTNGFFGGASLAFYNLIFFDATYRMDQSSTLPEENRTYFYPSVSGSFLFSELADASWLQYGKVRLNYAEVGNGGQWGYLRDIYIAATPFNSNPIASVSGTKRNPDLKEERTKSLEAGIEMNMFQNRLRLDAAVYKATTIDQIMPVDLSFATGYNNRIYNAGDMENKGIELSLGGTPVKTSPFQWDITVNWTRNVNEVIRLYGDIQNLAIEDGLQGNVSINARLGEPYGTLQGTDFVYHENGQPIVRSNGYYQKSSTSDIVIGYMNPDWIGGVNNAIRYKDLALSFLIDFQHGGDIFSLDLWYGMGTGLYPETVYTNDLGNPVRDPVIQNTDGTYDPASGGFIEPGVLADGTPNTKRIEGNDAYSYGYVMNPNSRFIYDASFVKLRELVLTYNLPSTLMDKTFISNVSVSFIGSNLWIIHKNLPYADPEASQGAGNVQGWQSGVMPAIRNFGFSLNLQF